MPNVNNTVTLPVAAAGDVDRQEFIMNGFMVHLPADEMEKFVRLRKGFEVAGTTLSAGTGSLLVNTNLRVLRWILQQIT